MSDCDGLEIRLELVNIIEPRRSDESRDAFKERVRRLVEQIRWRHVPKPDEWWLTCE